MRLYIFFIVFLLAAPSFSACVTDDTGTQICLDAPPARAISLYGAFTETIEELGAGKTLVARTKSDESQSVANLPVIGTGLRPDMEMLIALKPELVIARSGKAGAETLNALRERGIKVAGFDPESLQDVYSTIERLGTLFSKNPQNLVNGIKTRIDKVKAVSAKVKSPLSVAFEVRAEPLTVAGKSGLVNDLIEISGAVNAASVDKKTYQIDTEALLKANPDVYLVQQGPMNVAPPSPMDRPNFLGLKAIKSGRVLEVDERVFSRPGPKIAQAAEELSKFLYPELWKQP